MEDTNSELQFNKTVRNIIWWQLLETATTSTAGRERSNSCPRIFISHPARVEFFVSVFFFQIEKVLCKYQI